MNRPNRREAEQAVRTILQYAGEDVEREGLVETPKRVIKAWDEMLSGYNTDVEKIFKVFEDGAEKVDQMVIVKDINIQSFCEHHMIPFFGKAHIAYIPNGKVVGLSKLARVAQAYARRLQIQERLTEQIASAIETHLKPLGVAVMIECKHLCMNYRGAREPEATTVTTSLKGLFKLDNKAREEFLVNVRSK